MQNKKPFYEQVAEKLIEQLRQGTAPWQKPWDGGGLPDFMPHNAITGRRYRGINNLWLQAQGRKDPRWITYKQASSIGAQVRRGEKGTVVEYWQFTEEVPKTDEKGQEIIGQDGKPEKETVRLERPKVFHAVVFNGEQIDGLPPLKLRPLSWNPDERAENILKNSGAVIDHRHGDRAFYSPSRDSITLPLREQFESPGAYYETALHELGHWTGHADRLNRDLSHPFGSEGYAREELRAEIASLMLSQELGVSFNPGQHASYVPSWIMVLQDDPMEIMRAASDAEKIQGYVMAFDQVREIEQQNEAAVSISDRQNIDEASLAEEKNLINAVDKNDVAAIINFMAEEKMHEGLKRFSLVISEMDDATFQNAFWQRHQKPENGESFMENLNAAKEALDEAIEQSSYRTVEEQIRQFLPEQDKESVRVVSDERVYVQIPYADREQAKMLGAKWDKDQKSWYIPEGVNTALFARWMQPKQEALAEEAVPDDTPQEEAVECQVAAIQQEYQAAKTEEAPAEENASRVYLAVPYEEKEEAKALGAKWDKANKSWFMESSNANLPAASKWLPEKQQTQSMPAMSPVEEFADKLREMGCVVANGHPFMDGQKHRIETVGDKKGERSGFYVGHLDGHPAGYIKNNRTGAEVKWKAKGYSLSPEEKAKLAAEAAQKLQMRSEQKKQAQEAAVGRIKYYMESYLPVQTGTPYLNAKGIKPQPGIFTDREGQKTFIPVYNAAGELRSMQYIQADGTKRFAKDSEQEGCMHVVGQQDLAKAKTIILSEGYATAASIKEATDDTVASVAAFNSGNLPLVAKVLSAKYPQAQFLVAGDDDLAVEAKQGNNPGKEKALEAAKILNCRAVFPVFAPGEQSSEHKAFTDFNDLAQKSKFGREGLAKQINEAIHARPANELQTLKTRGLQEEASQDRPVEQTKRQQRATTRKTASRGSR
ncbi:zincin-like metallopeptidase domain-containing protein [Neisseria gonorrhoeae]|uniref:zincin-like metallopeptidase domain-containing protein n=1 Tax=Neisseria gonorrhoeae TaxID=485 RepID=UPI0034E945B3